MRELTGESTGRFHYGWVILVMSTMVVFGALGLARFGYSVVLPSMQAGLGLDNTQAGGIATANLAGYLALSVLGGALASRFGPRAVIAVGLTVVGVSMVLTGVAGGFVAVAAWRVLAGMGSGASNVPVMGLVSAWFAKRRRGLAAGIVVAGSSLALIVLGPLTPRILAAFGEAGWRYCWGVFGVATLVLAVCSYVLLRNRPSDMGVGPVGGGDAPRLAQAPAETAGVDETLDGGGVDGECRRDAGGTAAETAALHEMPSGGGVNGECRRDAGGTAAETAALHGMPSGGGVNGECRRDAGDAAAETAGLQWGAVYRSLTVWHLGLVYVAFGFSYIIYLTFFVKYLMAEGGYTAEEAGRLFMVMGWFSVACGLIWGTVSDVIGRRGALMIVYVIQAVAFGLFALWPSTTGYTASAILFGLTAWSIPAIMAATCGDWLGPRLAPAGLGFVTLFFGIGQAFGPMVAGAMADAAGSFRPAMLLAAGVALAGAVGAAFLRRTAPESMAQE